MSSTASSSDVSGFGRSMIRASSRRPSATLRSPPREFGRRVRRRNVASSATSGCHLFGVGRRVSCLLRRCRSLDRGFGAVGCVRLGASRPRRQAFPPTGAAAAIGDSVGGRRTRRGFAVAKFPDPIPDQIERGAQRGFGVGRRDVAAGALDGADLGIDQVADPAVGADFPPAPGDFLDHPGALADRRQSLLQRQAVDRRGALRLRPRPPRR